MADMLFEIDDATMAKLSSIARGRGLSLEDYVRELIVAEARRGGSDDMDVATS